MVSLTNEEFNEWTEKTLRHLMSRKVELRMMSYSDLVNYSINFIANESRFDEPVHVKNAVAISYKVAECFKRLIETEEELR